MKKLIKQLWQRIAKEQYDDIPYPLQNFHLNFIHLIKDKFDLCGKRVLEIGGSNFPHDILFRELKVKKWVSVDYVDFWVKKNTPSAVTSNKLVILGKKTGKFACFSLDDAPAHFDDHRYMKFYGDASKIPSVFYEQFDIVVSNDAFEHISPLAETIEQIYKCLNDGGGGVICMYMLHRFIRVPSVIITDWMTMRISEL